MKKLLINLFLLFLFISLSTSCDKEDIDTTDPKKKEKVDDVAQFIYDGMSNYYLWADQMLNKKPTVEDKDPMEYFDNVLYKPTDIWSWITDDVDELLADFEGEATYAFGFNPLPIWTDSNRDQLLGFVRYLYPNTPAEEAGIKRGDVITHINGQKITLDNYMKLYGATSKTTFTVLDQNFENPKVIDITPRSVSTNPVLFYDVYDDLDDTKKIGYLFYTGFISNFNSSLYTAFEHFKSEGVTDLVLDLRYNPGGGVDAAGYLLSLIAPKRYVEEKSVFTIMGYNNFINTIFDSDGQDRSSKLGGYNKSKEGDPLNANLDLDKVYIIATNSSASASELTTFCLRPFMDVVHIGEETSGKYTASWTVHAYDNFPNNEGRSRAQPLYKASSLTSKEKQALRNWAMQPIVGRYTDKNGKDFVATGTLIPNYPIKTQEYNTKTWKQIGDPEDYLFAKAISLITGKPYNETKFRGVEGQTVESGLKSRQEERLSRAVLLDNLPALKK